MIWRYVAELLGFDKLLMERVLQRFSQGFYQGLSGQGASNTGAALISGTRRRQDAGASSEDRCVAGSKTKNLSQRVHVGIWYILRAQRGSHIPTLRPKYIPYTYMDPLGLQKDLQGSRELKGSSQLLWSGHSCGASQPADHGWPSTARCQKRLRSKHSACKVKKGGAESRLFQLPAHILFPQVSARGYQQLFMAVALVQVALRWSCEVLISPSYLNSNYASIGYIEPSSNYLDN